MYQTGKLEEELRSKCLEIESLEAKNVLVKSALQLSQERMSALEARNTELAESFHQYQEEAQTQRRNDKAVSLVLYIIVA